MTEQPKTPTRDDLVAALRESGEDFLRRLSALPAATFEQGRYESGWNGRQILAHVAAIEWTYPRLLEIPLQAQGAPAAGGDPPTRTAQGGIDAYNARQVEKREGVPVQALLEEFSRNRETTIAAVAGADEGLFAMPIRSAGGVTGPLGLVIQSVAVGHIIQHGRDIAGEGG
ncbi:MAG: maleylpyruvate isomerase N-terminal domain-containing protein [Dehalococcoidia bacterium]